MISGAVALTLLLLSASTLAEDSDNDSTTTKQPKVQVTRAALHVARSLNPDLTETLSVKTRNGDIATLIVRKRDGKSTGNIPPPISVKSTSVRIVENQKESGRSESSADSKKQVPPPVSVSSSGVTVKDEQSWKSLEQASPKSLRSSTLELLLKDSKDNESKLVKKTPARAIPVPEPVYIRSEPMYIKGEKSEENWKRAKSLLSIDSDGIPVITGVRVPDDESDKRVVWRNARVINNILVPSTATETQPEESKKKEVVKRVLEKQIAKEDEAESGFQPIIIETTSVQQPEYVPINTDAHDRILEYINTVNQKETKRRQEARMVFYPVPPPYNVEGSETPASIAQSPAFKPRMLHYSGSSVYPTSLLYSPASTTKMSRISFEEGVRTPVLQYAHPELGVQNAEVDRKQDDLIQDDNGEMEKIKRDNTLRNTASKADTIALTYFSQDIHSDRSPYAYEPGLESDEMSPVDNYEEGSSYERRPGMEESRQNQPWPQKSLAYLYQQQEDTYGLGSDKYIKRFPYTGYQGKETYNRVKGPSTYSAQYPNGGHEYYAVYKDEDKPFWEKLGETIKEHVQVGMEKVTDLTRPVMEPLVEATHKISRNLGFSTYVDGEEKVGTMQDKVGTTAAAYPVLLPALGLMAGGAALGLGAVAVGRYLDVDTLKRELESDDEEKEDLKMEHKRAMEGISRTFGVQGNQGQWILSKMAVQPQARRQYDEIARKVEYVSPKTDYEQNPKSKKQQQEEEVIFVIEEEKPSDKHKDTPKHVIVKRIPKIVEKVRGQDKVPHVIVIEQDASLADHRIAKRSADVHDAEMSEMQTQYRQQEEAGQTYLNNILQNLERSPDHMLASMARLGLVGDWSDTVCAKKMFCDAMVQQSEDSVVLMEKKMATFLALVKPNDAVSDHLSDVMTSVKRRDCSSYSCQHNIFISPSPRSDIDGFR